MKIKKLLLLASVMTAFALSAFINASPSTASFMDTTGSGDTGNSTGASCTFATAQQTNSVIDVSKPYVCGTCTVFTVNVGWQTGVGAKYSRSAQTASGLEVTCKSSPGSNNTCTFTYTTNVTVNCPPAPVDANATGTGPIKKTGA